MASLLWGAYLGGRDLSPIFDPGTAKEVLGLLAAAAVAIVPLGFLISTLSVMILRTLAKLFGKPTYEAVLDGPTLDRIWPQLQSTADKKEELTLYVTATFDHELLAQGIHTWLLRRWNSFNVAAHSIVALVLALALAPIFSIPWACAWLLSTITLVGLLFLAALFAWRDTMAMIEFQSYRQQKGSESKDGTVHKRTRQNTETQKGA